MRRLGSQGVPDDFTQAAVDYLLLLAKAERDRATNRRLTAELPAGSRACARFMNPGFARMIPPRVDPAATAAWCCSSCTTQSRCAQSNGNDAVYDTWRKLLTASFKRNQFGVATKDFIASSVDAQRITQGLVNGLMDWPKFIEQMAAIGVQLRIKPGKDMQDLEVQSLAHFKD